MSYDRGRNPEMETLASISAILAKECWNNLARAVIRRRATVVAGRDGNLYTDTNAELPKSISLGHAEWIVDGIRRQARNYEGGLEEVEERLEEEEFLQVIRDAAYGRQ